METGPKGDPNCVARRVVGQRSYKYYHPTFKTWMSYTDGQTVSYPLVRLKKQAVMKMHPELSL